MKFLNDPSGLAVVGGMHSPPYLTYRDRINDDGILLLLPWSAAGPITRTERRTNWIFRVSVDDTKAGAFLVESAVVRGGCVRPALVLLNSGWGRANETAIRSAMKARGLDQPAAFFMDLSISDALARVTARDVIGSGADCVIYVGETRGGAPLMTELAKAKRPVRVFSHWGITGADFVQETTEETRSRVDLRFLQTCMPFGQADVPAVQTATAIARSIAPDQFTRLEDLDAPVGFVHGYDLGLILMAALRTQPTDGSIADLRVRVRDALEHLPAPVEGLMKTYLRPFSDQGFDSHEALGAGDLCLAQFDADGRVVLPRSGAAGSL